MSTYFYLVSSFSFAQTLIVDDRQTKTAVVFLNSQFATEINKLAGQLAEYVNGLPQIWNINCLRKGLCFKSCTIKNKTLYPTFEYNETLEIAKILHCVKSES